ncbi:MAG: zf-HC2 domain-containing protein [Archangium sp.]|nr:zf-HC2 domain-containing protein [Archangium sp.]
MKSAAHQYEDKLLEFAYGELPQHEADAVDAHVRGCNRCAQSLSEIRGVRATMARLPLEPAPDTGLESLLAYAEQAAKRSSTKTAPSLWKRFLAPLASVMALVTVGVIAFRANQEFDTTPASAIADQKLAERSKEQAEKPAKLDPVAVATPPADGLVQQQDVTTVAPAPIVAAAAPDAPAQEEERANKLKGKEGKKAALDDLNESGGKRGDVWAPEPKAVPPQSATRRAQTKSPPIPAGNDEQVARTDNFSDVGLRGAGLAKDSAPPPPPPPAKEPAQDKVGYGLSPGGSGAQAGGTYGGVDTETPATKPAPMKVAEKQKAEKKEEEAKQSAAGEQWAQPSAPVAVAPAPSPPPSTSSSSYAPSAPSKKLSKGSLQMPQLRNEGRTSLGAESDDSQVLEKTDSLAANSDAKFAQRTRDAARTQSLESARVASSRGDRVSEIRLLAQVLENGATGYERLEALKRICDAYEFLGEADTAAPFCEQVLREFPTSAAARAVSDRRKNAQRAPKPSPKSPAPSREQRAFDEDSSKPAEAAPTQAY